jgi:hypothetical protein
MLLDDDDFFYIKCEIVTPAMMQSILLVITLKC